MLSIVKLTVIIIYRTEKRQNTKIFVKNCPNLCGMPTVMYLYIFILSHRFNTPINSIGFGPRAWITTPSACTIFNITHYPSLYYQDFRL